MVGGRRNRPKSLISPDVRKKTMKYKAFLLSVAAATILAPFALTAWGEDDPLNGGQACTEIGCTDILTVRFVNSDEDMISGVVGTLSFGDETIEFDCSGGDQFIGSYECRGNAISFYAAPETAELVASNDGFQVTTTLNPVYQSVQPNGEGCPPICDQGVVEVTMTPRPAGQECTEIGCDDILTLQFVSEGGEDLSGVSGTLYSSGEGAVDFDCSGGDHFGPNYECRGNEVVFHAVPETAELVASNDEYEVTITLNPVYESVQPNGEGCPPICDQGVVEVTMTPKTEE